MDKHRNCLLTDSKTHCSVLPQNANAKIIGNITLDHTSVSTSHNSVSLYKTNANIIGNIILDHMHCIILENIVLIPREKKIYSDTAPYKKNH